MADPLGELRRIDWDATFPFTRLFKSFRMAVQPSKLALALAGVILMGLWGYLLDGLWRWNSQLPIGPEVWAYWQTEDIDAWRDAQRVARRDQLRSLYGPGGLLQNRAPKDPADLDARGAVPTALADIKSEYHREAAPYLEQERYAAAAAAVDRYDDAYEGLAAYRTRGIFESFMNYEQEAIGHFLGEARDVLALDWRAVADGTDEVLDARDRVGELRRPGDFNRIGMLGSVLLMLRGVQWLFDEHFIFAVLFLLGSLAIWSLFGGAICRMSALTAARDEQISARSALNFAGRKFFAFFTAPLLPLAMAGLIALVIFLGSLLLMAIPYVGDILGPLLLVLALIGGLVMTAILVGALGGGQLLWPTVATEGSDGFDAIARSYTYFFSRPWRLVFYTIVAAIYGAVTYIVLRYLVYVLLMLTRFFVSLGTWMTERPGTGYVNATKVEAMWPRPTLENLMGDTSPLLGLTRWTESVGSVLIHIWVLLVVLLLCAYLLSFFFSAATIIYLLLRQRVDATDIEDVYVDEEEETVSTATESAAAAASSPAAPSTPPSPGGESAPGEQPA